MNTFSTFERERRETGQGDESFESISRMESNRMTGKISRDQSDLLQIDMAVSSLSRLAGFPP